MNWISAEDEKKGSRRPREQKLVVRHNPNKPSFGMTAVYRPNTNKKEA